MLRLTSARAESTRLSPGAVPVRTAHLRSRGEHSASASFSCRNAGSPPLARRAPSLEVRGRRPGRLTSARAESTNSSRPPRISSSAHLRSRGEHWAGVSTTASSTGSPPLARRALGSWRNGRCPRRLTSARAESTFVTCTVRGGLPFLDLLDGRRSG
ncbi:hypothetical protein STAN_7121 [Streptomyces sp. CBMAI 2042]|nr:hypothetical protein STAN_7121 [Streptomyces sp. CBMAI 2042]